jgi:flagellar biosynthesis protein FlhG
VFSSARDATQLAPQATPHGPVVWAIGGGKGGIGKSFISSTLAICLTRFGKNVTLVDLDLGSANLHTCLGLRIPEQSLGDFIGRRVPNLQDISVETDIAGLNFISGFNDALNVADIPFAERIRLTQSVRALKTQFVILDLGAGTSEAMLDFFLAADRKVVAVTPEPTSIENAYRFIKSSFYRKLRLLENELGIQRLIEEAMDSKNQLGIRSPADLIHHLHRAHPESGSRLLSEIGRFQIQLLLNQARARQDADLGLSMRSVCRKYFGIEADYLGHIDHDNSVWQALRKRRPMVLEYPNSAIIAQFLGVTKNLLNTGSLRAVV